MNILITGGLGFIGSFFSERLAETGNTVRIIDNFSGHSKDAYQVLSRNKSISIFNRDIVTEKISDLFKGIDRVYHFAANSKISEGVNNPRIDLDITVIGTHKVLTSMADNGVGSIIYTSGSGVYGDQDSLDLDESFGPLLTVSYYGASKLSAEGYISSFCNMCGFKANIFRFANVVGYRQTHGVAYDFFYKLKSNPDKLTILGDGNQSKSYIDVSDIFSAVNTVIDKQTKMVDVFNVSSDDYITVNQIADLTIEAMELNSVRVERGEDKCGWKGDVPKVRFNSDKLKSLGWSPKFKSLDATKNALEYLIQNDYC